MKLVPGTRIFHAWHSKLRVGTLPTLLFCNGHTYFVQKMPQRLGVTPFMAHVTHVFGGDFGKRHRLRETMLFSDDVAYYADGKFLTFDFDLPAKWLRDGSDTPREAIPTDQMELGKWQVKQFLDAAMIARLTDRILVVPQLWCGCDKFWYFMTKCRVSNSEGFQLPFVCPLDHVLNPQHFDELGIVDFRESSFLIDPRVPGSVTNSRFHFYFCGGNDGPSCEEATAISNPETPEEWLEEAHLDTWWAEKLNSPDYADYRIIHISPMSRAVSGMADEKYFNEKWKDIARRVASVWCCHKDGPVKYYPTQYE